MRDDQIAIKESEHFRSKAARKNAPTRERGRRKSELLREAF